MWPARQWWVGAWKDDMRPVEMLPSADLSCRVWGSAADSYQSTWLHTLMFTDNVAGIRATVCRYNEYIICECVHECVSVRVVSVLRPEICGKATDMHIQCSHWFLPAAPTSSYVTGFQKVSMALVLNLGGWDPPKGSQHESKGSQDVYRRPKKEKLNPSTK